MRMQGWRDLWKGAMLRGSSFTESYRRLRMLYSMEDPWDMASEREQTRFRLTNDMLAGVVPHYDRILELGCGEGHQSAHLAKLTAALDGVDISPQAIDRARQRHPEGNFAVSKLEDVPQLYAGQRFDLITACEVLYYIKDSGPVLTALQGMSDRVFVSNYRPRYEMMQHLFTGPGWRHLGEIAVEDTVWDCAIWERAAAS